MEKSFEENKPPEITKTDTNTIELKEGMYFVGKNIQILD